jgi:two-component system LytT family response regulator
MNKTPVLIVEDEKRNQKLLTHMIRKHCPSLEIIGCAEKVSEATKLLKSMSIKILFLDIQLKDGSGFDVLNQLEEIERPKIIFTTAFDEYALDAFKYSAVNYLLKPIDKEELIDSVQKAIEINRKEEMASVSILVDKMMNKEAEQMITVSGPSSTEFIRISDIIHITAMGGYSKIILNNGRNHIVSKVIKTYDQMLKDREFFRVHQSHLINLRSVRKLNKGDHTIILENGDEISIARNRKEAFLQAMNKMIL